MNPEQDGHVVGLGVDWGQWVQVSLDKAHDEVVILEGIQLKENGDWKPMS